MKEDLDKLADRIMSMVDDSGTVIDRGANPITSWLTMKMVKGKYHFYFYARQNVYGNGSSWVEIRKATKRSERPTSKSKLVWKVRGNYIAGAYKMGITTDRDRSWMRLLPEVPKK